MTCDKCDECDKHKVQIMSEKCAFVTFVTRRCEEIRTKYKAVQVVALHGQMGLGLSMVSASFRYSLCAFHFAKRLVGSSNGDDVGEDTGCSNACSCSVTDDNHGVGIVALGVQQYDVVGTLEVVGGMSAVYLLQTD